MGCLQLLPCLGDDSSAILASSRRKSCQKKLATTWDTYRKLSLVSGRLIIGYAVLSRPPLIRFRTFQSRRYLCRENDVINF